MIAVSLKVRQAEKQDQHQIANLMFFESHVHRHLDWRAPLDWLGSPNFWVLEENDHIAGVLACPQDLPDVTWIRLFSHINRIPLVNAWDMLWETAQNELSEQGGATVAIIAMQNWMQSLVKKSGFENRQQILMLEWNHEQPPQFSLPADIHLRLMTPDDLSAVAELDAAAFAPLWQNSFEALIKALPQATLATVAEDAQGLLGYQISTGSPFGAHLARLAIRPDSQGRGFGTAMVGDLIQRLSKGNVKRVTVNTQDDNRASLALYQKMGFTLTGEQFPVFCFDVPPLD